MLDKKYLLRAIKLSNQSKESVGCGVIIVANGKVIARAFNSQRTGNVAINHAEIKAIIMANQKTKCRELNNSVAYCSCEPCAMCLTALSYAKVDRIVFNKTMKELFPKDRQPKLNSREFINHLNFIPQLVQLDI
jgi:tRNA(adenine34) deaminase